MSEAKETANEILVQLLQRAVDGVDKAVEFSQAQIPDVVEQLLMWKALESCIYALVGLLMVAISVAVWRYGTSLAKMAKKAKEEDEDWVWLTPEVRCSTSMKYDFCVSPVPKIISGLIAFIGFMVSTNVMTASQSWGAPKLYLLEYATSLVK